MTADASSTVAGAASKGARRGSLLWVQGLACGALLTFAAPTAVLLILLLAPVAVCFVVEAGAHRGLVRAVGLGCGAASLAPVWHLWLGGDTMDLALATLSDPATLLLAWGCGAASWALCQVLPVIIRSLWDIQDGSRARAIEAELHHHRTAWNLEDVD